MSGMRCCGCRSVVTLHLIHQEKKREKNESVKGEFSKWKENFGEVRGYEFLGSINEIVCRKKSFGIVELWTRFFLFITISLLKLPAWRIFWCHWVFTCMRKAWEMKSFCRHWDFWSKGWVYLRDIYNEGFGENVEDVKSQESHFFSTPVCGSCTPLVLIYATSGNGPESRLEVDWARWVEGPRRIALLLSDTSKCRWLPRRSWWRNLLFFVKKNRRTTLIFVKKWVLRFKLRRIIPCLGFKTTRRRTSRMEKKKINSNESNPINRIYLNKKLRSRRESKIVTRTAGQINMRYNSASCLLRTGM